MTQVRPRTLDEVRALGLVTDVVTAGACFGLARTKAHELVRAGQFPVPALKVGGRWVVPVAPIVAALSGEPVDAGTAA